MSVFTPPSVTVLSTTTVLLTALLLSPGYSFYLSHRQVPAPVRRATPLPTGPVTVPVLVAPVSSSHPGGVIPFSKHREPGHVVLEFTDNVPENMRAQIMAHHALLSLNPHGSWGHKNDELFLLERLREMMFRREE